MKAPLTTVRIFDLETDQVADIPQCELAPGWVKAQVSGVEGEVYVERAKINRGGEYRHPPFDPGTRSLLEELSKVFWEVFPSPARDWEDNLRRDATPDSEIVIWLAMATTYLHFTKGKKLSLDAKRDYFIIILHYVGHGSIAPLETLALRKLSKARARSVIAYMQARAVPISIFRLEDAPGSAA